MRITILSILVIAFCACNQDETSSEHESASAEFHATDSLVLGTPGLDVANYIIPVSSGGYLVAGYVSTDSGYDGYLVRTDTNLDTLWTRTYGQPGDNRIWSVAEDTNGDFFAVGFSDSEGTNGALDTWVLRVNNEGSLLWEKKIGGDQDELSWEVKRIMNGNFAIASQTASKGAGNFDAWLLVMDGSGELIWEKAYGSEGRERVFSIAQGKNGHLFATGIYTPGPAEGPIDSYTISVSAEDGALIWEDRLDKGADDTGHGLIEDPVEGVWVTGYTTSLGNGGQDGFLAKYINGEVVQFSTFGGPGNDRIMNVTINGNKLSMVGYSSSHSPNGSFNFWLQQANFLGDSLTSYVYPGKADDRGVHIFSYDQNLILVGTRTPDNKTNDADFTVVKVKK